jgi:hypothetical protein
LPRNSLPVPRFARLVGTERTNSIDWKRWDVLLVKGASQWEAAVTGDIDVAEAQADTWPDCIHDALAAAGKEMTRLAEERQELTETFAGWLINTLRIDEDRFSGMTHLRGGQSDVGEMGWSAFADLVRRNRRACGKAADAIMPEIEQRYGQLSERMKENRSRFSALDAAIDRIVWQLVGLNPDGSIPSGEVQEQQDRHVLKPAKPPTA